jgi:dolichyl-phosphate-mannose-protein mannosyltransferase
VAALAVAVVAAVLTFARLGHPDAITFDETYYVADARDLAATGSESSFAVHPPLGKWVIAAGIALVGDTPTGWRAGGALLSVLAVAATVDLVRRLTGRVAAGVVAGVLVLTDGVWLSVARLAMLDSVLAALVTFGTWALVVDHQRATARSSDLIAPPDEVLDTGPLRRAPPVSRWPLVASGVLFGLAVATKWSGLLALGGAGLLAGGWELAARRRRGGSGSRVTARAAARVGSALVVVPIAVYAVSWLPWTAGFASTPTAASACTEDGGEDGGVDPMCDPPWQDRLAGLGRHHLDITRFHGRLDAEHPYRAPATTWPAQVRPVVAHYVSCDADGTDAEGQPCAPADRASEVAILGNPALWWSGLILVPLSAAALRRRDGAAVVPLVMLGSQFLPWLAVGRPVFNFYTAPLVPMLATALVVACVELDRPARRAAGLTSGALAGTLAGGLTLLVGGDRPAATTAAVVAATVGVGLGGSWDARRERRRGVPAAGRRVGTITAAAVCVAAIALLVHLGPLWLAIPVEESVLRRRWWLRSWV